jgi:hypothetical protein
LGECKGVGKIAENQKKRRRNTKIREGLKMPRFRGCEKDKFCDVYGFVRPIVREELPIG